jgi:hypothetical protein
MYPAIVQEQPGELGVFAEPVAGFSFSLPDMVNGIHVDPVEPAFLSDHLAFPDSAGMGCQDITPRKQVEPATGEVFQFQSQAGIIPGRVTRYRADEQELIPVCTHDESRTRLLSPDPPKFNWHQEDVPG